MSVSVILVHGAWADASSWSKVITRLEAEGVNVFGVQLPLTSLGDDIKVTQHYIKMAPPGPKILVGHSYGGAVITGAAAGVADVEGLVYISAFGLDEGESLEGLSKQGPASPGAAAVAPDNLGFLWIDRKKFHDVFVADATASEAYVMAAVQKPLNVACFGGVSGVPAWRTVPSWYLVATNDKMIPPPAQHFMAERMGAIVKEVEASHAIMIAHPREVADIIMLAVEAKRSEALAL